MDRKYLLIYHSVAMIQDMMLLFGSDVHSRLSRNSAELNISGLVDYYILELKLGFRKY